MLPADYIDIYCERTEIGLLNEPFNAVTNLAFIIAATYLYTLYHDRHHKDRKAFTLIALVLMIGIGSGLFHMFASYTTMLADILPITFFVFYYLWVALQRFLHWSRVKVIGALAVFAGLGWLMEQIPAPYNLNHSAPYLPCLAAIVYLGLRMKAIRHESTELFFIAATWFAVSLFFRINDIALCDMVPIGTHFIWHLCNSVVLALLTKIIIEHPPLTLKD